MRQPRGWLVSLFVGVTGIGCASERAGTRAPPTAERVAVATSQPTTRPAKKPFVVDEAPLPEGYPPAGPVGQVIVKHYPAARVAVVRSESLGSGGEDRMFGSLFNHIKKHDIAMSTPVDMGWSSNAAEESKPVSMAFVYGKPTMGQTGPDGNGPVEVVDVPAMTVVSVGVRGSYDRAHFVKGLGQVRAYLAEHAGEWEEAGPPRFLGYNSPFVPWFMRFGEVQVPVRGK